MKPINPLKVQMKAAGLFQQSPKVESSHIKRKPVNTAARLVTAPRPWWADPPPGPKPNIDFLEGEIARLREVLKTERQARARIEERLFSTINRNKETVETIERDLSAAQAEIGILKEANRKLMDQLSVILTPLIK